MRLIRHKNLPKLLYCNKGPEQSHLGEVAALLKNQQRKINEAKKKLQIFVKA